MTKLKDLTGFVFGKLTVLELHHRKEYYRKNGQKDYLYYWLCECECGNQKIINGNSLKQNLIRSCGCLKKEQDKINLYRKTHNCSKTRLYKIWQHIKERCYKQNCIAYKDYGGRGIIMCDEWKNDFINFKNWAMNNGYKKELTIDRINNNDGYNPNNCRWVTMKEQNNNKRNNFLYKGQSLKSFCDSLNLNYKTVFCRIKYLKWDVEKAINTPIRRGIA